jgi:hypothetical protein
MRSARSPERTPPTICWALSSVVFASGNDHSVGIVVGQPIADRLSTICFQTLGGQQHPGGGACVDCLRAAASFAIA